MKPYYSHAGVTIYHGDCREILPLVNVGLAVVTDQPYGTGWVRGGGAVGEFNAVHERPEWDIWDTSWISQLQYPAGFAVFGPASRTTELRAALPRPNQLVWWRKTNPRPNGPPREPICIWPGNLPPEIELSEYNGDTPLHPAQKPLSLMKWVVQFMPEAAVVDPFMGSGTTLAAAKELGREAIGIDINEAYCEIAAKRLSQEVLNFTEAL